MSDCVEVTMGSGGSAGCSSSVSSEEYSIISVAMLVVWKDCERCTGDEWLEHVSRYFDISTTS